MGKLLLYPAIDLLGGHCLDVRQADAGQVSAFDGDPLAIARRWREAGAAWLHIVDLDGAREGKPLQTELAGAIAEATGLPIQFGGGIASEADAAAALEAGAARVILDTAAARDPSLLATCLARWGERIAVSLDARGDAVTVAGWLESTSETALEFAQRLVAAGVRTLLMADIERDGTLVGGVSPRLLRLRAALPEVALIAAGRIGSLEDVRQLALAGMNGVILGRALYSGALDLADALRVASETEPTLQATPAAAGAAEAEPTAQEMPAAAEPTC